MDRQTRRPVERRRAPASTFFWLHGWMIVVRSVSTVGDPGRDLCARPETRFAQDVLDVALDGSRIDDQRIGDLTIASARRPNRCASAPRAHAAWGTLGFFG
jgi:hypothetical protein